MAWHLQTFTSFVMRFVSGLSVNSLAPGKFEWHFKYLIFQIISVIDGWGISCELALRWMSLHFTDDKSTLVQVMAWCRQATSHYLGQCWPRSLSPYGITGPQWVNPWTAGNTWVHNQHKATDAQALKHQAITSHNADEIFIVLGQFRTEILHLQE